MAEIKHNHLILRYLKHWHIKKTVANCLKLECIINLFLTLRKPLVNRKRLMSLTLVGPPKDIPVTDPLAVLHLDNQLLCLPFNLAKSLSILLPVLKVKMNN